MNYRETLDYLYAALPMFHRIGPAAYKPDLSNTIALAQATGNPEIGLRCIHIAGTNGKGSTSHMLASVLQAAGYRTGLYTSPHLRDFRERMRVDGEMVPEEWITAYVKKNRDIFEQVKPSFFEMSTVMAFAWFREMNTDIAVIETGLGGRLDSTNIVSPALSIITNIGWDHMHLLGNTLALIAHEKSGIIKKGIPVVIGESSPETREVFEKKARTEVSDCHFAEEHIRLGIVRHALLEETIRLHAYRGESLWLEDLECDLTGSYQLKNIRTVLLALDLLRSALRISDEAIREGLRQVKASTGLRGRWQVLSRQPLVVCDTGHNEQGLMEVTQMLNSLQFDILHIVLGVVEDKDLDALFRLLPSGARYYFCKADIPRGLDASVLKDKACSRGLSGEAYSSVAQALEAASKKAGGNDLVFVGGSTFTVAEVV